MSMSARTPGGDAAERVNHHAPAENEVADMRRFALRRALEHEDQRGYLARVLHDDIGQTLMAMNLGLYRLTLDCGGNPRAQDTIASLRNLLLDTSRAVRRLAAEFRPCAIRSDALQELLSSLCERISAEHGIVCAVSACDATRLPGRAYATALYRTLRLALNGIARHYAPTEMRLDIREEKHALVIRIGATRGADDNGDDIAHPLQLEELREWICVLAGELRTGRQRCGGGLLCITLPMPE